MECKPPLHFDPVYDWDNKQRKVEVVTFGIDPKMFPPGKYPDWVEFQVQGIQPAEVRLYKKGQRSVQVHPDNDRYTIRNEPYGYEMTVTLELLEEDKAAYKKDNQRLKIVRYGIFPKQLRAEQSFMAAAMEIEGVSGGSSSGKDTPMTIYKGVEWDEETEHAVKCTAERFRVKYEAKPYPIKK